MKELMVKASENFNGTGFIALDEFLKFNKIKSLADGTEEIAKALEGSKILELNKENTKVHRLVPIDMSKDVDACSMYIENIPETADYDLIKQTFSAFGQIDYISLPKFPETGTIKGFAFIEFDSEESMHKACKYYGAKIPEQSPLGDGSPSKEHLDDQKASLPIADEDSSGEPKAKVTKLEEEQNTENEDENVTSPSKRKKKTRRKVKTQDITINEDKPLATIRAMTKAEWREWKKKYLKLQRESFKAIRKRQWSQQSFDHEPVLSKDVQDRIARLLGTWKPEEKKEEAPLIYDRGLIVRIIVKSKSVEEFVESVFRKKLREIAGENVISYIDVSPENTIFKDDGSVERICNVRCQSAEKAHTFLQDARLAELGQLSILIGDDEMHYWRKVKESQEKKREKREGKLKRPAGKNTFGSRGLHPSSELPRPTNTRIKFD